MPPVIRPVADIELLLITFLQAHPLLEGFRFCTDLPNPIEVVTIRVTRVSGAKRNVVTDRPVVDFDVFSSPGGGNAEASGSAIALENVLALEMRNLVTPQGVVQSVTTTTGFRWLPDINQDLTRYSGTYEFHTHGAPV